MTRETKLVTLRDILYIFFKNKVVITIVFLVAVIGALLYCTITPPIYRAEAKILVRLGKAQISGVQQMPPEQYNLVFQERTQNIRNEMELLKGEYLSEKVVARMQDQINARNLQKSFFARIKDGIRTALGQMGVIKQGPKAANKEMIETFMSAVGVTFLEDTDMIRLTFDWPDPRFAAVVANAYADEYINQHTQVYETQRSYRFYVEQIELYEKKLQDAENDLQGFISKANLANIELQKDLLLRNIGDLTSRLSLASVDVEQSRMKLKKVQEMANHKGSWIETPELGSSGLDKQAYLRTLDDSYFKLKVERERMLKYYTPISDEVKAIDVQLERLRSQKAESLVNLANMEISLTNNKKSSFQREIGDENRKLETVNAKTLQLKQLQRTRDMIEATYQAYKKKAEDLRISDDLDARKISSVKVAVPAIPPLSASYPKKGLIVGMAAFIGLFFGFGFSAVREFFNHTFKDEDTVRAHLDAPLLLSVPMLSSGQGHSFFGNFSRGGAPGGRPAKIMRHLSADNIALVLLSIGTLSLCGYFSLSGGHGAIEARTPDGRPQLVHGTAAMANLNPSAPWGDQASADRAATMPRERAPVPVSTVPQSATPAAQEKAPEAVVAAKAPAVIDAAPVPKAVAITPAAAVPAAAARTTPVEPVKEAARKEAPQAGPVKGLSGVEHVVSRGQSLVTILQDVYHVPRDLIFNESIELVKAANPGLSNYRSLKAGQKILIPGEVLEMGKAARSRDSVKG